MDASTEGPNPNLDAISMTASRYTITRLVREAYGNRTRSKPVQSAIVPTAHAYDNQATGPRAQPSGKVEFANRRW